MEDAKRFAIDESTTFIPSNVNQFICPVIGHSTYFDLNEAFHQPPFGLQIPEAKQISFAKLFQRTIPTNDLYKDNDDAIQSWDSIIFNYGHKKNNSFRKSKRISWYPFSNSISKTLYGFALWWKAELGAGSNVFLSTSPFDSPTHWEQAFLPLLQPFQWKKGQTLGIQIHSNTNDLPSIKWDIFLGNQKVESGGI
jgi:hypothetical protein